MQEAKIRHFVHVCIHQTKVLNHFNTSSFQMASALMRTVPCDKCENLAAKFHCDTCGHALCPQCKEEHLKSKETRHHEIVEYAKKLDPKYLAGLLCHSHNTEDPEFWCNTCDVPICISCITGNHNGHKFSKITVKLGEKRDAMLEEVKDFRDKTIIEWEDVLNEAKQITAHYCAKIDDIDTELKYRAKDMHAQVDAILSESRQTLQKIKTSGLDKLQKQEQYLTNRIQQMKADVRTYEQQLSGADQDALLQYKEGTIQCTEKPPSLETASVASFIQGQNDNNEMQKIFGKLVKDGIIVNPSVLSLLTVDYGFPRIACVGGGLAWIRIETEKVTANKQG